MRAVGDAPSPQPRAADHARRPRRAIVAASSPDNVMLDHLYMHGRVSPHQCDLQRGRFSSGEVLTWPVWVQRPRSYPNSHDAVGADVKAVVRAASGAPSSLPPVQSVADAIAVAREQASSLRRLEYFDVLAAIAPCRVCSIYRVARRLGLRRPSGSVPFKEPVFSEAERTVMSGIEEAM